MAPHQAQFSLVIIIALSSMLCVICAQSPACGAIGVCECKTKSVNCSDHKFVDFPEKIPGDTISLYLQNNRLKDIHARNLAPLQNLASLFISNNLIRKIRGLPPSLQNLYGQHNNIDDIFGMLSTGSQLGLKSIKLQSNDITSIPNGTFKNSPNLRILYLSDNPISNLYARSFSGLQELTEIDLQNVNLVELLSTYFLPLFTKTVRLSLGGRNLQRIEPGALNFSNSVIQVLEGHLPKFPAGVFGTGHQQKIELQNTGIATFSPLTFKGIKSTNEIDITGNSIVRLPGSMFKKLSITASLSLRSNKLEELPDNFLESSGMLISLDLSFNRLRYISNATFTGLTSLISLYLFQNPLISLASNFIAQTSLETLYIFNGNIHSIARNTFRTKNNTLTNLYMYYNPIRRIEDFTFDSVAENAKIYMSKDKLDKVPVTSNLNCSTFLVGENDDEIVLKFTALNSQMNRCGFTCKKYDCIPCPLGTYGDQVNFGCNECPAGGFYQDKVGQMADVPGGIGCKLCNKGTFVPPDNSPGRLPSDCEESQS